MKHIKSYRIFENKNKEVVDEFFSVMQGTPEGTDFMKWFVCDPKRTGRFYITTIRGTGVYIPKAFFDKISDNKWMYSYSSSGGTYGEKYGDLRSLFINMITDGVAKNLPPGIKKSEFEEYLKNNPITPGTLPSNINPIIDRFINSERKGLIKDMRFLKDIPWIKMMTDLRIYTAADPSDSGQFSIRRNNIDMIMGISSELEKFLSTMGIKFYFRCSIGLMRFISGTKGRKRQKTGESFYGGMKYDFYLGYETEEEIINIVEKDINKCLSELVCKAEFNTNNVTVSFMQENLESLIKTGTPLPDYDEKFNNFIADIIGERIQKDYSKIALLKNHEGIIEILRQKRPDIFGKSEEATKDLIKGASALKRFGTFDND